MDILSRLWRVIRANLNRLMSEVEDPERILEQTVLDMQGDLIDLRQAVAQAIATQKRTERQWNQAETTAEEWYRRAQLALRKGEEGLAREALMRRKSYLEMASTMKAQLQSQGQIVEQLKQSMRQLESKISEAKAKKDLYIARVRSAKASEKLNQILGNLNTGNALSAFERMEDRVMQWEARSEAITDLDKDSLNQKFKALEAEEEDIEVTLAALKTQMLPGNSPTTLRTERRRFPNP